MDLYHETELVDISELDPYSNNPKKHPQKQIEKLKKSIKEFGFTVPLIIGEDNEIIAGHGRLKAAEQLGIEELPCIKRTDLTEEQMKAFRIADNKLTESEWDNELLNLELEELEDLNIDTSLTGFEEEEILELEDEFTETEEDDFEDELDEDENPRDIQKGDVYKLGDHRLMCGDATKEKDVEKLMNESDKDLILTDPPFGINLVPESGVFRSGDMAGEAEPNTYNKIKGDEEKFDPSFLLKYSATIMIFGGNHFTDVLPQKPHWLVWDKKDGHEDKVFGDAELIWTNIERKSTDLYSHQWRGMIREGDKEVEGKERVHPTQKPVGLLGDIIKDYSEKEDNILDLFGGSGSTLIACEQLDRRCYMMEIDPHYCNVIIDRWEEYTGEAAEELN